MKKVIKVPYIDQTKEYPTGCESISTVMLLWYLKITVTPEQFIDDYLIKEPMQKKGDRLYGPDPFFQVCREVHMMQILSGVIRR